MLSSPIALFSNAKATTPREHMTLGDFLAKVKSGEWKVGVESVRSLLPTPKLYEGAKTNLRAVTLSCDLSTRAAGEPQNAEHSGYLQLDFDVATATVEEASALRNRLTSDPAFPWIAAAWLSPNPTRVKALARIDGTKHLASFKSAQALLAAEWLEIDPSVKDIARLCFVSYDPDLSTRTPGVDGDYPMVPVDPAFLVEPTSQDLNLDLSDATWSPAVASVLEKQLETFKFESDPGERHNRALTWIGNATKLGAPGDWIKKKADEFFAAVGRAPQLNEISNALRQSRKLQKAGRLKLMGKGAGELAGVASLGEAPPADPQLPPEKVEEQEKEVEEASTPNWEMRLSRKKNGDLYGSQYNAGLIARYAKPLEGKLTYNEFTCACNWSEPPYWWNKLEQARNPKGRAVCDADVAFVREYVFADYQGGKEFPNNIIIDGIEHAGRMHPCHPVREYLEKCRLGWDGKKRVGTWLRDYLDAKGNQVYVDAIAQAWLVQAIARVMDPSCQADYVLVLEGQQGIRKSSAVAALCPDPAWHSDKLSDIAQKDAVLDIAGKWLIELPELSAVRSKDWETIKSFISRRTDRCRIPYGRLSADFPRQCVFVASTNETEYLSDPTGGRRFWPVDLFHISPMKPIDTTRLAADRDQLWGEAAALYASGAKAYLEPEVEALASHEQLSRCATSGVEIMIQQILERTDEWGMRPERANVSELACECYGLAPNQVRRREQYAVGEALRRLGWIPRRSGLGRWYERPGQLARIKSGEVGA